MAGNVFIQIDYDEELPDAEPIMRHYLSFDQSKPPRFCSEQWKPGGNYRGVKVSIGEDVTVFATGNPQVDYSNATAHADALAKKYQTCVMELSSVTHFVWDVPGWRYDETGMLVPDK